MIVVETMGMNDIVQVIYVERGGPEPNSGNKTKKEE